MDSEEKRRLAGEEASFVLAVLIDRPLATAWASGKAVADQAFRYQLPEFNYTAAEVRSFREKLPNRIWQSLSQSAASRRAMPVAVVEVLHAAILIASAIALAIGAATKRRPRRTTLFVGVILAGIVFNIVICGALSTPHDRYSARVLWLIPLVVIAWVGNGGGYSRLHPGRIRSRRAVEYRGRSS